MMGAAGTDNEGVKERTIFCVAKNRGVVLELESQPSGMVSSWHRCHSDWV